VRIGLAGCGRIAERGWLPAIAAVDAARLVSVADVDTERAKAVAPGARVFTSAEELVAAGGVDALVVATPPASHLLDAGVAAGAGLPSLVEKPPAPDAAQARQLAELRPPPWIGFNRRFEPALQRVRERLPTQGRLQLMLTFHYRQAAWQPHVVADPPLLDVGTHLLDLARWLTRSELRRVRARELSARRARLELELERGLAFVSCANDRLYYEGLEVRDERGSQLAAASRGGLVHAVRDRLGRQRGSVLVQSLTAELAAFCRAVREGTDDQLATAADGVAAMTAVEGARRSADSGGVWVDVSTHEARD
jgi:myo-inositol 2-dehydrogenase / D-chiro-inositol 1-dehydrogenase